MDEVKNNLAKKIYNKPFEKLCNDRKKIIMAVLQLRRPDDEIVSGFVKIPKSSFKFSRYVLTVLLWVAWIFKIKWVLFIILFMMVFPVIFTIEKDPLIWLYSNTIGRIFKSKDEFVNIDSMRFANGLCSIISLICLLFLYFSGNFWSWILVAVFAIFKTVSAITFCPASKLYSCAIGGDSCCSFLKRK